MTVIGWCGQNCCDRKIYGCEKLMDPKQEVPIWLRLEVHLSYWIICPISKNSEDRPSWISLPTHRSRCQSWAQWKVKSINWLLIFQGAEFMHRRKSCGGRSLLMCSSGAVKFLCREEINECLLKIENPEFHPPTEIHIRRSSLLIRPLSVAKRCAPVEMKIMKCLLKFQISEFHPPA